MLWQFHGTKGSDINDDCIWDCCDFGLMDGELWTMTRHVESYYNRAYRNSTEILKKFVSYCMRTVFNISPNRGYILAHLVWFMSVSTSVVLFEGTLNRMRDWGLWCPNCLITVLALIPLAACGPCERFTYSKELLVLLTIIVILLYSFNFLMYWNKVCHSLVPLPSSSAWPSILATAQ